MNKLPTAKEFIDMHPGVNTYYNIYEHESVVERGGAERAMIEFAKIHVKAALKETSEKAEVNVTNYNDYEVDKNSILNAYPLENIK